MIMEHDGPKSRTQKKNEDRALQKLGENLMSLSEERLAAMAIPEALAEAVRAGKKMKQHGARRRQLQYIGALMRNIDADPIRRALDKHRHGDDDDKTRFKRLEAWRDALKNGDLSVVEDILDRCPDARREQLMQLVDKAREPVAAPKASRTLFRYLDKVCCGEQAAIDPNDEGQVPQSSRSETA